MQCGTMVLEVTRERVVTAVSPAHGLQQFRAKAVVLAMGCRERTRGGADDSRVASGQRLHGGHGE